MAFWVIGYGFIQAIAPKVTGVKNSDKTSNNALQQCVHSAKSWIFVLCAVCVLLATAVSTEFHLGITLLGGLMVFGFVFAINSSLHSYLILAYTNREDVSLNVGFYYMANACGRLLGTLLSGTIYLVAGLAGCLWGAAALTLVAGISSLRLPDKQ
jgi:MFS family permease